MKKQRTTGNSQAIFLLTEGFNKDSFQRILQASREAKIFTTEKEVHNLNTTYTPEVAFPQEFYTRATALHIFGYGLDRNALDILKNTPVIFHPSVIKNSITTIGYTQKLTLGEPLLVQGSYNNSTSSPAKMILKGFSTNLDSTILPGGQTAYFQLTATPKHLDKAVYSLIILSGKDTLEQEPLPLEIKTSPALNILILAGSPDFENKFLIDWLAKNNYKFAVRTKISKDKYDRRYVNIPAVNIDRLTPALSEKFDVVIADAAELSVLPAADIAALKSSVENKGVGLIVKVDTLNKSTAFYLQSFPLTNTKDSVQQHLVLSLSPSNHTTSSLKTEQPVYIRPVAGTQALIKDQLKRIVVINKLAGLGKVILTSIRNTYAWQLAGNENDYSYYWSLLLQKAAKDIPLQDVFKVTPALPQKNKEAHITLQSEKAVIPHIKIEDETVAPEQNYRLPYEWGATFWPRETGWHSLHEGDGTNYWWYVYNDKEWKGVKTFDKLNATKRYAEDHPYKAVSNGIYLTKTSEDIPKLFSFILFIICTGFLWLEKKINNRG